jgi:hypothetical protein
MERAILGYPPCPQNLTSVGALQRNGVPTQTAAATEDNEPNLHHHRWLKRTLLNEEMYKSHLAVVRVTSHR